MAAAIYGPVGTITRQEVREKMRQLSACSVHEVTITPVSERELDIPLPPNKTFGLFWPSNDTAEHGFEEFHVGMNKRYEEALAQQLLINKQMFDKNLAETQTWLEEGRKKYEAATLLLEQEKMKFEAATNSLEHEKRRYEAATYWFEEEKNKYKSRFDEEVQKYEHATKKCEEATKHYEEASTRLEQKIAEDDNNLCLSLESLEEVKECKICMAKERSILLYPCGHYMLCATCAESRVECDFCGCNVVEKIRVYR